MNISIYTYGGLFMFQWKSFFQESNLLFVYLVQFLTCFVSYCNGAFPGMD